MAVMTQRTTSMKTEPAFAAVLGLDGDSFDGMLRLQHSSNIELIARCRDIEASAETRPKTIHPANGGYLPLARGSRVSVHHHPTSFSRHNRVPKSGHQIR